jgi:hypothetical protein
MENLNSLAIYHRGLKSFAVVEVALRCCGRTQESRNLTLLRLLEQFEDFVLWSQTCLQVAADLALETFYLIRLYRRNAVIASAFVLVDLIQLDPRFKAAFFDSPTAMDVLLALWSFWEMDSSFNPLVPVLADGRGCPIVFLWTLLTTEEGEDRGTIINSILSSKSSLRNFCKATIGRVQMMPLLVEFQGRLGYTAKSIHLFFRDSFNVMCRATSHPRIQSTLHRSPINFLYCGAKFVAGMNRSVSLRNSLLYYVQLHQLATLEGANPIVGLTKLIESGVVPAVLETLIRIKWNDDSVVEQSPSRMGKWLVQQWRAYSFYPGFVLALSTAIRNTRGDVLAILANAQRIAVDWIALTRDLDERSEFLTRTDITTIHLCDNRQVGRLKPPALSCNLPLTNLRLVPS